MTLDSLLIDEQNRIKALAIESFIVEAPAGAGKTELLTQRYLKLLQKVNAPEEIIAITFTNKAAAEMRLRILDSLIAAAEQKQPPEAHKQITYELSLQALQQAQLHDWQLIQNPSRLRIFTIDSLCAHLARQMPLMSRFGAQPKVTDDANLLYTQAAEQTLALLENADYTETVQAALRYVDNDATKLTNLLVQMLAKRDQWLPYAQGEIDAAQLQHTLQQMISQTLQSAANAVPAPLQYLLMPIARFAAGNLLAENAFIERLLIDWQTPLQAQSSDLSLWCALADFLLTNTGETRKEKGLNVKFGFPPNPEGKAQKQAFAEVLNAIEDPAALHRVRSLPNGEAENWQIITTLSKLLNLAVAQLWLVFQHAGEVDFIEIAQRATNALIDESDAPTELALKLDYQIAHMLVDEFQDTSPSQIALIKALTKGWQAHDNRTLFCVGDPMQSIYRFRKANVGLFIDAATEGIGDIRLQKLQLYRNNRACPPVVDWINATFANIFPTHDNINQGAIHYRPFIATKTDENTAGVAVCAIIKTPDEPLEAAKQREAEAAIRIIQQERAQNPNASIAVLVRSKKHLTQLVSQLRRAHKDIAFQAVEIEALAGRQIVQDLLSLTHALHHKADRVHWLAILRAPWCGLTLRDLHTLAGSNHHATIWQLMHDDELIEKLDEKARLLHMREILTLAFNAQGRMNTSRWVRSIWLMLGGTACLWDKADVLDVQAFFACMDALDRSNQFSPTRMAAEITKLFATPDAHGEQLQMMSIHKSKGLEFDCVILLGLGAETGGGNSEKPLMLWEEMLIDEQTELLAAPYVPKGEQDGNVTAFDYLETLESERDAFEAARVLYVAATRAERKLHLVGIASQNAKGEIKPLKNSYLDLLWSAIADEFKPLNIAENSIVEQGKNLSNTANIPPLPAGEGWGEGQQSVLLNSSMTNFTPQLIRLPQLQIPKVLQTEKIFSSAQNKAQQASNTLHAEPNIQQSAGTLAHRYLEIIAKDGLANWPASRISTCQPNMQHWLMQQGHEPTSAETAAKQIAQALQTTLNSSQGQWVLQVHENAQNELAIYAQDGTQHAIDRTFIAGGARWIIDYKLGLDVTEQNTEVVAQSHQTQLARYAALFTHEGLPIKTAVLFLKIGKLVEI